MYELLFQSLGLALNEARIYEALLEHGKLSVSEIAARAGVHRRNVYDSLNRLTEKALVFEVISQRDSRFVAADPAVLAQLLEEKQRALTAVMPELSALYGGKPQPQEVLIYEGVEGWKQFMRDTLRIGEDVYVYGGKGSTSENSMKGLFAEFKRAVHQKNITWWLLYDEEVRGTIYEGHLGGPYRFLPLEASSACTTIALKDRVFFFSDLTIGGFRDDTRIVVQVNEVLAEAHRHWFKAMWARCEPVRDTNVDV